MLCHTICLDMGKNSSFGLVLTKIAKEINGYGELQGPRLMAQDARVARVLNFVSQEWRYLCEISSQCAEF